MPRRRKGSRRFLRIAGAAFRSRLIRLSVVVALCFYVAIRFVQARQHEIERLDAVVRAERTAGTDPMALLAAERARSYAEVEFCFYALLVLIPGSFIIIAVLAIIRSSSRERTYGSGEAADPARARRDDHLREKVRAHFASKGGRREHT